MSNHVQFVPFTVRGPRDPALFNDTQDDLIARSDDLGVSNFAEEGLDEKSIENGISAQHLWHIEETTRNTGAPLAQVAWTQLALSGTTFRETFTPDLVLGANDKLVIRARIQFESVPAGTVGLPSGGIFEIRANFQLNGGGSTAITESVRMHDNTGFTTVRSHPSVCLFTWIDGAATLDWVELQYQTTTGGPLYVGRSTFDGILYREVA